MPENFEFVKKVKTGENSLHIASQMKTIDYVEMMFELESISMSNDNMIFNHYASHLPNSVECIHPEIIKHSFDIYN